MDRIGPEFIEANSAMQLVVALENSSDTGMRLTTRLDLIENNGLPGDPTYVQFPLMLDVTVCVRRGSYEVLASTRLDEDFDYSKLRIISTDEAELFEGDESEPMILGVNFPDFEMVHVARTGLCDDFGSESQPVKSPADLMLEVLSRVKELLSSAGYNVLSNRSIYVTNPDHTPTPAIVYPQTVERLPRSSYLEIVPDPEDTV